MCFTGVTFIESQSLGTRSFFGDAENVVLDSTVIVLLNSTASLVLTLSHFAATHLLFSDAWLVCYD